jgi:acetyltransferase-like isoleucine patch superfamily enzyme
MLFSNSPDLAERIFINQGCTFLDHAGIRLGEGVMVGPKVTFERVDRRRRDGPARRQDRPRRRCRGGAVRIPTIG